MCKQCNDFSKSKVIRTVTLPTGRVRIRVCTICGSVYETHEVILKGEPFRTDANGL